jgi:Flp pilus assembly protein TadD
LLGPNLGGFSRLNSRQGLRDMHRLPARLLASAAAVAIFGAALAAGGCSTTVGTSSSDTTGSIRSEVTPRSDVEWRQEMNAWGARYRANPADPEAAIKYAQSLRAVGQRAQAAAVLEQAAVHNPDNRAVLGAYGRALADNGNSQQALDVLNRAHTQDQPDWRILSVQGAVLDQMGRHADAQRYYASALRLMPDEPSVLSNLGLSYALSKNLPQAETTLRHAAEQRGAEPKVRQNLALVVGLQGRFQEAEKIASGDLSPAEAQANVAYLRQMLAEQQSKKNKRSSPLIPSTGS